MANSVASSSQEKSSTTSNITDSTPTKEASASVKSSSKNNTDADKKPESNLTKEEKLKRFENEGVEFKAKLIGSELVMEPRGDKMCQSSIQRLKAMIKGLKSHKKRILLKISYDGVKIYDEKTNEILHHHEVPQISYIASDDTDARTFGYVCDLPNKGHQFICFKTAGPALTVMSTISSLFEAVLEKKNVVDEEQRKAREENSLTNLKSQASNSIDLVGDSGIMDADLSFSSDINFSKQQALQQQEQEAKNSWRAVMSSAYTDDSFNNSAVGAWPTNAAGTVLQSNNSPLSQLQLESHQQLYQKDQSQSIPLRDLYQQQPNPQQQQHQQQQQQSSAANAELLFSDLFFGLSDPIIVSNNDSLVTSKMPLDNSVGAGGNQQSFNRTRGGAQLHHQTQITNLNVNQQQQQQQLMMQQQQRTLNNSGNNSLSNNPFDPNSSINSNSGASSIMRPRPSSSMQAPQPIPPRTGFNRQSTLNVPGGAMSPLSLPRAAPMMQEPAQRHNRSLVHNHSSVSLSDAALTRQFSFNTTSPSNQQAISESYADRYSVFNDIDNLPSIFESTSLGNVNSFQAGPTKNRP